MRTFELLLIMANLVSLLLGLSKRSQRGWLGMAGIQLSLLILHALVEGLRYQMAFAYLFVALFGAFALLNTSPRFYRARTPGALKGIAASLAFVLLLLTALLAYALPVFRLPQPTGSYPVGVQYFHFSDQTRADPFLDASPRARELMVKIYYPAQAEAAQPYADYFHGSPALIQGFAAFYGLPDFAFDHFRLVKTHSKEGLPPSAREARYPVVLFSHGAGTSMEVQTAQAQDLASHGYLVAVIDHTYVSAATAFPDRLAGHHDATTDFAVVEPAEIITQIMADDARFVMDMLAEINAGQFGPHWAGKLDLERIGAMGHSVGGATAYNLALHERRVKAAINLDGVVYLTPGAQAAEMAPFLMLAGDQGHLQAIQKGENLMQPLAGLPAAERDMLLAFYGGEAVYQAAYDRAQQNLLGLRDVLKASGNLYTIQGSDHMKFTDIGLFFGFRPLRELLKIGGETDPARCLEISSALTRAFFDQHLKGAAAPTLEALPQSMPELKKVILD